MSIAWMFIGLSMFSYGIGNITSYLNIANKIEVEHQAMSSWFDDLCINTLVCFTAKDETTNNICGNTV